MNLHVDIQVGKLLYLFKFIIQKVNKFMGLCVSHQCKRLRKRKEHDMRRRNVNNHRIVILLYVILQEDTATTNLYHTLSFLFFNLVYFFPSFHYLSLNLSTFFFIYTTTHTSKTIKISTAKTSKNKSVKK